MNRIDRALQKLVSHLRTGPPRLLEDLAADTIGRLLGVQVVTSRSGFQFGGDAGSAGRQDRHLRIECKRYGAGTPLGDRELQGEINDAIRRRPGLEVWILVATTGASEGTQETLNLLSQSVGVPVLIYDWTVPAGGIPDLAALCAFAPDIVEKHYGKSAEGAARSLAKASAVSIKRIQRDLEVWHVGFKQLRKVAQESIKRIWASDVESRAAFGQNAAGGASPALLPRSAVAAQLDRWWQAEPATGPVAAFGAEGVGKTWAVLHWIVQELDVSLPITLLLASSAMPALFAFSEVAVLDFLAKQLYALTGTQGSAYWERRLRKLLERPLDEGPVLLLFLDGVNQEPSFDWLRLLQILQGGIFAGRVRTMLTTQTYFLDSGLRGLKHLAHEPVRIGIEPYDISVGGELDQALLAYGCTRGDFSKPLLELARIPRLLPLVVKLSSEATLYGEPTVNTLLWAYGRDDLSNRTGNSFTHEQWLDWLTDLARAHLKQIVAVSVSGQSVRLRPIEYSVRELQSSVLRADQRPDDNARRLNEIVDGTWLEPVPGAPHRKRPKLAIIHLALGLDLLSRLAECAATAPGTVESELTRWLDPVAATSVAADILAAAVSIASSTRELAAPEVVSAVLTALLQSQNVGDTHRTEVRALAAALPAPLLDAVERSSDRVHASARQWALESLKALPPSNTGAWDFIDDRLVQWVLRVRCPTSGERTQRPEYAKAVSDRLLTRIGVDHPSERSVMGATLKVESGSTGDLARLVPVLMQGRAQRPAVRILVAAAIAAAVGSEGDDAWDGLRWVVLLNEVDRPLTVETLEHLSLEAMNVPLEDGLHVDFGKRVSALLLWLTSVEGNEAKASHKRAAFERAFDYQAEYLANPARNWYELERRHVKEVLASDAVPVLMQLRRVDAFLPDPTIEASQQINTALQDAGKTFDVQAIDVSMSQTQEDLLFDQLRTAAARFAPDALARLVRRHLAGLAAREEQHRHWAGIRSPEHLLLAGPSEATAAAANVDEKFLRSQLLLLEVLHAPAAQQLDRLVGEHEALLHLRLLDVLRRASSEDLSAFIRRWGPANRRAAYVIANYVAHFGVSIPDEVYQLLLPLAVTAPVDDDLQAVAFIALAAAEAEKFGHDLVRRGWKVSASQSTFEQESGSRAVLSASADTPLENLRTTVSPVSLLSEARRRGSRPEDAKVAALALSAAVMSDDSLTKPTLADVTLDVSDGRGRVSLTLPDNDVEDDGLDQNARLQRMLDPEAGVERYERAKREVDEYLTRAKNQGAVLTARWIDVADARLLVQHCSAEVERWTEGVALRTPEFRNKVNRAGGLFLALCEVLLEEHPERGVELWHALTETLRTRFIGQAGINELAHLIFRAPDSEPVLSLRDSLYSLRRNPTDKDYLETVMCARLNGQDSWLNRKVSEDEASGQDWRRMRAILVSGFIGEADPAHALWNEGPTVGTWGALRNRALLWTNRQGQARYWWRQFLKSTAAESAYAAWQVFLTCADRRAWAWIHEEMRSHEDDSELWRLKMLHFTQNRSSLSDAMEEREKKGVRSLDSTLLVRESPGKWLGVGSLSEL